MPSGTYYRLQAALFARLAMVSRDPQLAERYHRMAAEQLSKAEKARAAANLVSGATAAHHDRQATEGRN